MLLFFKDRIKSLINIEEVEKRAKEQGKPELEKGDMLALMIAAARVFAPMVLLFGAIIFAVAFLFLHGA